MVKKRHKAVDIIGKLREAEVLMAQGRSVTDAAGMPHPTPGTVWTSVYRRP
jgi:hypothetical protein